MLCLPDKYRAGFEGLRTNVAFALPMASDDPHELEPVAQLVLRSIQGGAAVPRGNAQYLLSMRARTSFANGRRD